MIRRVLAITAVVVTALLLQSTVFSDLKLLGVRPELMYLVTIVIAILEGPREGMVVGFVGGMAQDFLLNQPKGITALTLTLVGYAAGLARQYIVSPSPLLAIRNVPRRCSKGKAVLRSTAPADRCGRAPCQLAQAASVKGAPRIERSLSHAQLRNRRVLPRTGQRQAGLNVADPWQICDRRYSGTAAGQPRSRLGDRFHRALRLFEYRPDGAR